MNERTKTCLPFLCCDIHQIVGPGIYKFMPSTPFRFSLHEKSASLQEKFDNIASAHPNKVVRHLLYSSENIVALEFIDSAVLHETKKRKLALHKPVDSKLTNEHH